MLYVNPAFWLTVFLCATTNFTCRVVYRAARLVYSRSRGGGGGGGGGGRGDYRAMQVREGSGCCGAESGSRRVDDDAAWCNAKDARGRDARDAKLDV